MSEKERGYRDRDDREFSAYKRGYEDARSSRHRDRWAIDERAAAPARGTVAASHHHDNWWLPATEEALDARRPVSKNLALAGFDEANDRLKSVTDRLKYLAGEQFLWNVRSAGWSNAAEQRAKRNDAAIVKLQALFD